VLTIRNPSDQHGDLAPDGAELQDLVAFMLALPIAE